MEFVFVICICKFVCIWRPTAFANLLKKVFFACIIQVFTRERLHISFSYRAVARDKYIYIYIYIYIHIHKYYSKTEKML